MYSINFTEDSKKFCLSIKMEQIVVCLLKVRKLKTKDSEIVAAPLCLGSISKDWSVNNRKTGLNGFVYSFSVDYDATAVDDVLYIRNYLMKNNEIV